MQEQHKCIFSGNVFVGQAALVDIYWLTEWGMSGKHETILSKTASDIELISFLNYQYAYKWGNLNIFYSKKFNNLF